MSLGADEDVVALFKKAHHEAQQRGGAVFVVRRDGHGTHRAQESSEERKGKQLRPGDEFQIFRVEGIADQRRIKVTRVVRRDDDRAVPRDFILPVYRQSVVECKIYRH
ncbi:hypothetical protein SDC9_202627 [bioreactor metagenome]|uniref:Uncharacterized protein n=1 Tax=bioreactor metagenome TaxID=1076179 RepID=A0A645IU56_9ZZZZ